MMLLTVNPSIQKENPPLKDEKEGGRDVSRSFLVFSITIQTIATIPSAALSNTYLVSTHLSSNDIDQSKTKYPPPNITVLKRNSFFEIVVYSSFQFQLFKKRLTSFVCLFTQDMPMDITWYSI